jgi:DNA polymerase III alpha subunit
LSLQLVSVIGNATKDAEKKASKDGVSYVTFRVAANNTDESTTFYNVVVFGSYGEMLRESITKGREIFVSGRLQVSEKGYVSVVANQIVLLRVPKGKEEEKEKIVEEKKSVGRPKKK